MKFDNKRTINLEDLTRLAHPEPRWWKVAGVALLGILGIALAGIVVSSLGGCGPTDSAVRIPDQVDVDQSAVKGAFGEDLTVNASAINGGSFGSGGFGNNFHCGSNLCSCDDRKSAGDCLGLAGSFECAGEMHCVPLSKVRLWCVCRRSPSGGGCDPEDTSCMLANGWVADGLYQIAGGGPAIYNRHNHDRACQLTGQQWQVLGGPQFGTLSGASAEWLRGLISGQWCTNEEAGIMPFAGVKPNGVYQTPDTGLHLKWDSRSCRITSDQWSRMFHGPIGQITTAQLAGFDSGMACKEMEISAPM